MNPASFVRDGTLRIFVKPAKRANRILGYDDERRAIIVEIAAVAQENKANVAVVKFFSKLLKKKVSIKSGLTSKEKILIVSD